MAAFTPMDVKERSGVTGPCIHKAGAQCSNKGFLPMSTAEYLQDRTGQDRTGQDRTGQDRTGVLTSVGRCRRSLLSCLSGLAYLPRSGASW